MIADFFRSVARSLRVILLFVQASWDLIATRPKTRQDRAEWLHRFCARALCKMGIRVSVHGDFPVMGALITNHLSYLDIIVLAAIRPCVFVSKREVATMPILGWMTTSSGTVYVDRGRVGSALKAGQGMHSAARDGLPVVFFPEGTTNPEDNLLKFHSGLLGQAMREQMPITAGYIRYSLIARNAPDASVARDIAWGETPMLRHIFRFLGLRGVQAEIYFADQPIAFSPLAANRKLAAAEARQAVADLAPARTPLAGRAQEVAP